MDIGTIVLGQPVQGVMPNPPDFSVNFICEVRKSLLVRSPIGGVSPVRPLPNRPIFNSRADSRPHTTLSNQKSTLFLEEEETGVVFPLTHHEIEALKRFKDILPFLGES